MSKERRVVVTGLGMISPLGLNVETSWQRLIAGESGIVSIDIPYTQIKVAGLVKDFDPEVALKGFVPKKELKRISRPAQFSTAAIIEAMKNAGLLNEGEHVPGENHIGEEIDANRMGGEIGTGVGGSPYVAELSEKLKAGERIAPSDLLLMLPERVASVPSMKLGMKGPWEMISTACGSGNRAITNGYNQIFLNKADVMVVGGTESVFHPAVLEAFYISGALANETDLDEAYRASKPFDKKRKGFVISEGATILILEEKNHAKKRGVKILAELVGYGNTSDAFSDTAPSGEGAERAIEMAIKDMGGLPREGLIYVHAHGTATQKDDVEVMAVRKVMKKYGHSEKDFAISSTKGATGHGLAVAGATGAVFGVKAMGEGILPPTINLEHPMDEALGIDLVPNKSKKGEIVLFMNNSFGFGGLNTVTVFRP